MSQPVLPGGDVTFLFTDVEDSTGLWQRHPESMSAALALHHRVLREMIGAHRGQVFQVVGDAFCAAFGSAGDAVAAAIAAQRALQASPWGETGPLRVRIGIHTGSAEPLEGDYPSSLTLIRAQRVMAAGHGGQTLLSASAETMVRGRLPEGSDLRDLGVHRLRGLTAAERLFQLVAPALPVEFPAIRTSPTGEPSPDRPLAALVRGGLVGRDRELDQLRERWGAVQRAPEKLVLVGGEPGVGKTRLAQELVVDVGKSGVPVLQAACYEHEVNTAYLPFVEAFRDWVHGQPAPVLRASLGDSAADLARLAPEIASTLGPLPASPPLPPNEERLRLFDSVARVLQTLAHRNGLVLFIDDLHWADQGTLSLLHYVLRRSRQERLLVIATYREIELDRVHPLAAALVDWHRERLAARLTLHRLSQDETGALLATLFGEARVAADLTRVIHRETDGNPFYVEEVVKSLVEHGHIARQGERWAYRDVDALEIPQSIKEAVGRRLSRLSRTSVDLLHVAAVLGREWVFGELAAVVGAGGPLTGSREDELLAALDESERAQLLRAGPGEGFAFTHDKIREVLYEELSPIRRRRLHQQIGESLERLYAADPETHAAVLGYHFGRSGDLDRTLTYSIQAAERAESLFAHDDALGHLRQAREAADALGRPAALAPIDQRLGDIHRLRGDTAPAVECYRRALAQAAGREAHGVLRARIGEVYAHVGDPRGVPSLEAALAELDPDRQRTELALAMALMGRYHHYRAEHRKAVEWLDRARVLAEPLDDAATLCSIYTFLAGAHQHLLALAESDQWARASLALGERRGFPLAVAYGHEFLSENAFAQGRWTECLEHAAQNHAVAERIGAQNRMAWAAFARANALTGRGELREARATIRAALDLCDRIGEARLAVWLEPLLAIVETDLGADEAAGQHGEQGRARGEALGQPVLSSWSLHGVGYQLVQRGEWQAAAAVYRRCLDLLADTENRIAKCYVGATAAEAFLGAGQVERAASLIAEQLAMTRLANARHYEGLALRVHGQILARRGMWDDAAHTFGEAVRTLEDLGSRLELGRALYHRARAGRAGRLAVQEQADVERARDIFGALGAARDHACAAATLAC
jgi:class 3 adenylate cyclase/tetratricopeptide (TPR) repeat protein